MGTWGAGSGSIATATAGTSGTRFTDACQAAAAGDCLKREEAGADTDLNLGVAIDSTLAVALTGRIPDCRREATTINQEAPPPLRPGRRLLVAHFHKHRHRLRHFKFFDEQIALHWIAVDGLASQGSDRPMEWWLC